MTFSTLDSVDVTGKRILLRVDLNVPMENGRVSDTTRIDRVRPTLQELRKKGARILLLSHFGRPKGKVEPDASLAPLVPILAAYLGIEIEFVPDCVGPQAQQAAAALKDGGVLLLENTRFHAEEEKNDPAFAADLAKLGDIYVNDAFSVSHRAHASTEGLAHLLPAYAGRAMEAELSALSQALELPLHPLGAIVGGAKVSTKLELLDHLMEKVDSLIIGGAMANTFLSAKGYSIGASLYEPDLVPTAQKILAHAEMKNCQILLPLDVTVAKEFRAHAPSRFVSLEEIRPDDMILDIGPRSIEAIKMHIGGLRTLVWNGPFGAFELPPFNSGTHAIAQEAARLTQAGELKTIAGGGDTVSALHAAGVAEQLTYVSTAGGAFLEWLEGKALPGVEILRNPI